MIQVVYHRDFYRLTVKGHAHSGEAGHDLVCASASILAYTLASQVANLNADGKVNRAIVQLNPGDTEVACTPYNRYKASVKLIFDSICAGFELLARNYPEFLTYEMRGKGIEKPL